MRLTYTETKTTRDYQDETFVNVVSTLTRAELKRLTAGTVKGNATTDAMRASVANAVATGHYTIDR